MPALSRQSADADADMQLVSRLIGGNSELSLAVEPIFQSYALDDITVYQCV